MHLCPIPITRENFKFIFNKKLNDEQWVCEKISAIVQPIESNFSFK